MAIPNSKEAWEFAVKFLKEVEPLYLNSTLVDQVNELQKCKYVDGGRRQGKSEYIHQYMQEWKPEMRCRNDREFEYRMRELKNCGCNRCRDEYYRLKHDYHRERDYSRNYYVNPSIAITQKVELKMTETKPVEEPKNVAVKTLVDKLKVEQAALGSAKTTIDSYKAQIKTFSGYVKTYNDKKIGAEKNIRELSVALKKLGHKDTLA